MHWILTGVMVWGLVCGFTFAQSEQSTKRVAPERLMARLKNLDDAVQTLEAKLLRLSAYEKNRSPERSRFLQSAFQYSQTHEFRQKIAEARRLIATGRSTDMTRSIETQRFVLQKLSELYEILESGPDANQRKIELERLRKRRAALNQLVRRQQSLRAKIGVSEESQLLVQTQNQIERDTESLFQMFKNGSESVVSDDDENSIDAKVRVSLRSGIKAMQSCQTKLVRPDFTAAAMAAESALKDLLKAQFELDNRLRQLRDDEIAVALQSLDERFQQMIALQQNVNVEFQKLIALDVPKSEKNIEVFKLAEKQGELIGLIDKSFLILQEEGTTVSVPAALKQARDSMSKIEYAFKTSEYGLQQLKDIDSVIKILQNLLKVVQQEKVNSAESAKPATTEAGLSQRPLVHKLAEIKLIRFMQEQLNERRKELAKRLIGDDSDQKRIALQAEADQISSEQILLQKMTQAVVLSDQQESQQ